MAIEKFKSYKSPGTGQIPTEMMQARVRTLFSNTHTLFRQSHTDGLGNTDIRIAIAQNIFTSLNQTVCRI